MISLEPLRTFLSCEVVPKFPCRYQIMKTKPGTFKHLKTISLTNLETVVRQISTRNMTYVIRPTDYTNIGLVGRLDA